MHNKGIFQNIQKRPQNTQLNRTLYISIETSNYNHQFFFIKLQNEKKKKTLTQ